MPQFHNRRRCFEHLETKRLLTSTPELVFDIRSGLGSSKIEEFAIFGGDFYFRADDGVHGMELWKSDGTSSGTSLVRDINPGDAGSSPGWFTVFRDELYFAANDASSGQELWKTDGTASGTVRVKDIRSSGGSSPADLYVFQNELYFSATDGSNNTELWKSDGTASGTKEVKDINSGAGSSNPGGFSSFYPFQGHLYFDAFDRSHGVELWRTDGTPEGTRLVMDVDIGDGSSWPFDFFEFDGDLYFTAEEYSPEYRTYLAFLYRVDGDSGIAERAVEVPIDVMEGVVIAGENLYFSGLDAQAGFEPFRSNGTAEGTIMLKDILPGEGDSNPQNFFAYQGAVYFTAGDQLDPATDRIVSNLWKTDGSNLGTVRVTELLVSHENAFVGYNGDVYFSAWHPDWGWELYKTGNATAEPELVRDIDKGGNDSFAKALMVFEDKLLILATQQATGYELWTTNGTTTEILADLSPGGTSFTSEPSLFQFFSFDDSLVFYGGTPSQGEELYIIRGTPPGLPGNMDGDIDGDGEVAFADFLLLAANFGKENASWEHGDFDGDRLVGFSDFLVMADNFGRRQEVLGATDDMRTRQVQVPGTNLDKSQRAAAVAPLMVTKEQLVAIDLTFQGIDGEFP